MPEKTQTNTNENEGQAVVNGSERSSLPEEGGENTKKRSEKNGRFKRGHRSENESALPTEGPLAGKSHRTTVVLPPKAPIPGKAPLPPKAPIPSASKPGTEATTRTPAVPEKNAEPKKHEKKPSLPPKAPVPGSHQTAQKASETLKTAEAAIKNAEAVKKAAEAQPQKSSQEKNNGKPSKNDRRDKPLKAFSSQALEKETKAVKEVRSKKDKAPAPEKSPETPSKKDKLFADVIPEYMSGSSSIFGFSASHETEDRILDSMPPDPTLDDVFALPADLKKEEPQTEGVEIVGIHFPQGGKVYYFDPCGTAFAKGERAIVETARGAELGEVALANRKVPEDTIVQPLKPVIRKASAEDLEHDAQNKNREKECEKICLEKIAARGLDMKLVGAQYTFDNTKLIFYFTAAQRVDFRELVKDLASVFHTRIELRQIGIRDEARMLGGKGSCGRKLCCSAFLPNYAQVTIKMAKEQGLALTSSKISGACGRLMCCLRFEQAAYNEEIAALPTVDSVVETPDGKGTVTELRPMAQSVKVKLFDKEESPKVYKSSEIKVLVLAEVKNDDSDYPRGRRDRDKSDQIDSDIPLD